MRLVRNLSKTSLTSFLLGIKMTDFSAELIIVNENSSYPGAYPAAAEPPPPYMSNANPNMAPNPMNSTINQSPAGTPRPQSTSTPAPAPIRPPAIPSSFPELEQKSYDIHSECLIHCT